MCLFSYFYFILLNFSFEQSLEFVKLNNVWDVCVFLMVYVYGVYISLILNSNVMNNK